MNIEAALEYFLRTGTERILRIWAICSFLSVSAMIWLMTLIIGNKSSMPLPMWGAALIGLLVLNSFASFIAVTAYPLIQPIPSKTPILMRLFIWLKRLFLLLFVSMFIFMLVRFIAYPLYLRSQLRETSNSGIERIQ